MLTVILLTLLLTAGSPASCPVPPQNQTQLYSDSIQISSQKANNNGKHDLVFNYQFQTSFNSQPSLAFGINEFMSDESPVIEIKIQNARTKRDGVYFRVQSGEESQWKNLKLNFIATTRNDLEFGSTSFENPQGHNTTLETFDLQYPLQSDFESAGLKVKPFISSFSIESTDKQSAGIKLEDVDIEGKKVYFSFSNPKRISLVRTLNLTVIVFNIYTPGVLYADGIIDQNYVMSKTEIHIPRHGINELRTYIVGINSFHASVAQKVSISSAIDETFTLIIGPINRQQIDFISVSYLILSVIDCGSCAGHPLLYKGICQVLCPIGYNEKNGKCVPIVCSDGYVVGSDGTCVPECGQNEEYSKQNDRCQCIENYFMIGDACIQCPPGTFYNFRMMTCDSLCGANAIFQNGRCFCNPGYYVIGGRCQACPKGTAYDEKSQTCESICSVNEVFNGQKCVCAPDHYNINNRCQKCPPETTYNGLFGRCDCINGKTWHAKLNQCVPICTQFQQLVGVLCDCKYPYVRINGVCGACPKHSIYFFSEEKCYCKFGFRMIRGECVCQDDEIFSEKEQRCVKRCQGFNEVWENGKCECPAEYKRDEKGICYPPCGPFEQRIGEKCQCIDGYYKGVYGPCIPIKCPYGHQWNPERRQCRSVCPGYNEVKVDDVCQCIPGYERELIYGVCQPQCPSNMKRQNGQCICSPGNKVVDGVCTNCPRYSQYIHGVCICYNGNPPIDGSCQKLSCPDPNQVYDPISKSCKCKGPLVWMRGRCEYIKGCGDNQYWCGTHCVCHYGYVRIHGKCVRSTSPAPKCPPYSTFDPVSYQCVCSAGYHPVRQNSCEKCPAHAYWDGHKCNNDLNNVCAQGYIYDGFSCVKQTTHCGQNQYLHSGLHCRCKTGFFWINGSCQKCPYGNYYDGLACVSTYVPACNDPYKFWNGRACVCIEHFFEYGDTCVRCPANTVWNGLCCKSPNASIGPLNVTNGY